MLASIETYGAGNDPAYCLNFEADDLEEARARAKQIAEEECWTKVVLFSGTQSGAKPLLTITR